MIYLDNSSTSFPKPASVAQRMSEFLAHSAANPGRSAHRLALQAELTAEKSIIPEQMSQLLTDQTVHLDLQASLKEEKNLYLQKLGIRWD